MNVILSSKLYKNTFKKYVYVVYFQFIFYIRIIINLFPQHIILCIVNKFFLKLFFNIVKKSSHRKLTNALHVETNKSIYNSTEKKGNDALRNYFYFIE